MIDFTYEEYMTSMDQMYDDPREYRGSNKLCEIDGCLRPVEIDDEYCDNHGRCTECGERGECAEECYNQYLIEQYNRNREYKDHIYSINEINANK
tara:strand:- start:90 stop:374 length:285 start_codon:yes stop_codon:yes gene_type:complete